MNIYKKISQCIATLLFAVALFNSYSLFNKVIIWDLNGVLLNTSKLGVASEIGFLNLLSYFGNPQTATFKALEEIWGPQNCSDNTLYAYHKDTILPEVLCMWQKGSISGNQIIDDFSSACDEGKANSTLKSAHSKRVVKSVVKAMFDPLILSRNTNIISDSKKLLKACKSNNNTLIIFSNMHQDHFEKIYNKPEMQDIFKHFKAENILISGLLKTMKPYNAMYDELKKRLIEVDERFQDPLFMQEECIFLDDQPENIEGAEKNGIPALLVKNNYDLIYNELEKRNFISE